MSEPTPLGLIQEQARAESSAYEQHLVESLSEIWQYEIRVTPRSSGDWHLSIVAVEYWTGRERANFDARVDTLDGCVQAIEATWHEHEQNRAESDSEPSTPSA